MCPGPDLAGPAAKLSDVQREEEEENQEMLLDVLKRYWPLSVSEEENEEERTKALKKRAEGMRDAIQAALCESKL